MRLRIKHALFLSLVSISIGISPVYADGDVIIQLDAKYRNMQANGLPNHNTGQFPNRDNPNAMTTQSYSFRIPLEPEYTGEANYYEHLLFGVALNGVPFDPGTAEFWQNDRSSGWRYEAITYQGEGQLGLDHNNAHVQPTGAYHYHGVARAILNEDGTLVGYAADGFPIYSVKVDDKMPQPSYRLKSGARPDDPMGVYDGTYTQDYEYIEGLGDLDECNGAYGKTYEYLEGTYYYVITEKFPFVPRCLKGAPDESFKQKRIARPQEAQEERAGQRHPHPHPHDAPHMPKQPKYPHHIRGF